LLKKGKYVRRKQQYFLVLGGTCAICGFLFFFLNNIQILKHLLEKIISGGQTGVDRAALDAALRLGIPRGGWCPQGRKAEDGRIPDHYPLQEASSPDYPVRTRLNVEDSDGTLVITAGSPKGGTALTLKLARKLHKPFLLVDLAGNPEPSEVRLWVQKNHIHILNVAGPREGESAGIFEKALAFLQEVLNSPPEK
jgi:Circularly permutated YpsA SLOG family